MRLISSHQLYAEVRFENDRFRHSLTRATPPEEGVALAVMWRGSVAAS